MWVVIKESSKGLVAKGFDGWKSPQMLISIEHGRNISEIINKIDTNIGKSRNPLAKSILSEFKKGVICGGNTFKD